MTMKSKTVAKPEFNKVGKDQPKAHPANGSAAHQGTREIHPRNVSPKVDAFLSEAVKWREETAKLRSIALVCGLTEELKWGKPCYTLQETNIVIIQGFKEYCALMFCKGALLRDPSGILRKPGESTQAARQIRFTSAREIVQMEAIVKSYVHEAIEAEKAGLKVIYKTNPEPAPMELQSKFDEFPALKTAFFSLTPGRQRAYILHFSAAKQSKTRDSRISKYMGQILKGKGLDDLPRRHNPEQAARRHKA
jgi:uncharacterized protein YdeI (YjbR/CyaY-like superfamily)